MANDQTIHASEWPVRKVFGSDFRFKIPSYQRPYAWEKQHVAALLEDLIEARDLLPDYFLGSIVLVTDPHGSHDVIDGQQRLTTLTILFAVIADLLPPGDAAHLRPFLMQEANPVQGLPATHRLTVREQEREFFERHVQEPDGLGRLFALDPATLGEVERRIRSNAHTLREILEKFDLQELVGLATYISQHAFLVVVRADQFETAYRIFTVMNDRGLELSASDILKAEVIGRLEDTERRRYAETWEATEEVLGRDSFSDLFSHVRMMELRRKATASILKELQENVVPKYAPREFIDDLVVPYGELLDRIQHASWPGDSPTVRAVNRHLAWLNDIDNFDWIAPLMRWMRLHETDVEAVLAFLCALDRLASSMYVRRVYVQPRVRRYGQLLDTIESGVDVLASSALNLDVAERRETLRVLDGDLYGMSGRVPRYVLKRLDAHLTGSGATWHHEVISIEHVLPQNPGADSEWTNWFDAGMRERWTDRLANLVPLNRGRNSAAQNYEFDRKKHEYFAVEGQAAPFVLTNQVLHLQAWTPDVLESRQRDLLAALATLWDLNDDHELGAPTDPAD